MNCRMTRGIYLRANGKINCYCSTGENIELANLPSDNVNFDFIKDYYYNEQFEKIRNSFLKDTLPFPVNCLKCNYFDPYSKLPVELLNKEIEWFHIEPVYGCNLKCPFCVHGHNENSKIFLSYDLFCKVVEDIKKHSYSIKWSYCSGRGEPTIHPRIWDIVKISKKLFDTNFLVNTNGNINYKDDIILSKLDKIKIAIDSLDVEKYRKYRIKGNLKKVLEFTKNISISKNRLKKNNPQIIWQKILFNFNDSNEEFMEYQKTALDIGVDKLRIVFTWTANASYKRPNNFSYIFPNIEILDTFERDNPSEEKIKILIERGRIEENISYLFDAISKILHWFEFGFNNREEYDNFASLGFGDIKLYQLRLNNKKFYIYIDLLHSAFYEVAKIYGKKRQKLEEERYTFFAEEIKYIINLIKT